MSVRVRCITDPACVRSWAAEPAVRALMIEFGAELQWTFVMGGMARQVAPAEAVGQPGSPGLVHQWLAASAESQMPVDPRALQEAPIGSTYPACTAVKAAQEQGPDAAYRYLRALREGIFCLRRKLDNTEALVGEAGAAGLDGARLRIDFGSHAMVESFGADLEEARAAPEAGRGFPVFAFEGDAGSRRVGPDAVTVEALRAAAAAAGAQAGGQPRPTPLEAIKRFGRMAPVEVAAVCDLAPPRAEADLAQLALEWRVRPVPVITGRLWEAG